MNILASIERNKDLVLHLVYIIYTKKASERYIVEIIRFAFLERLVENKEEADYTLAL
jgi:hypothetical protein